MSRSSIVVVALALVVSVSATVYVTRKSDTPSTEQPKPADDWCAEHAIAESECPFCDPGLVEKLGWCGGHDVPEAYCTRCNSRLIAAFKSVDDWCAEHGLPESQCLVCNPKPKAGSTPASSGDAGEPPAAHQQDEHDEHGDDEDHGPIKVAPDVLEEMGIQVAVVAAGKLEQTLHLTGEIVLNPDRLAHIVPRVGGIVRKVHATIGDRVQKGDVMAVLESSELAEAKANYLGAVQRVALAKATLDANQKLQEQGIVSELDFLAAQRSAAEAEITLRAADVKLHTYGFTHTQLAHISAEDEDALLLYELRAPFEGVVVEKHIALGELVTDETDVYLVADLSTVWVNLTVHQKDLAIVKPRLSSVISAARGMHDTQGIISYVSPIVDEATRTAIARVVLSNAERTWRPGLFVTAQVVVDEIDVAVLVPRSAIQLVEGRPAIFVREHGGFEPRRVMVGRTNETSAEITSGLKPGEEYVTQGAFILKAELEKASFGGQGHAHGECVLGLVWHRRPRRGGHRRDAGATGLGTPTGRSSTG